MKDNAIPIIVEFNGLPGLGKTTVANALMEELNTKGFKTISKYRRNIFHTLHHPFPELFDLKLYNLVSDYAKSIPPRGRKRTHVNWTNFYAQKYKSIEKDCKVDFAIIDEAIIQFLVAMAFQDKMPKSEQAVAIVRRLKTIGIKFVRVDCVNHIGESAKRIMSRPARGLLFESMQHDELISTLEVEAYNFEYLRSVFSEVYENQLVIAIDTLDNPQDNVQIILNSIVNLK